MDNDDAAPTPDDSGLIRPPWVPEEMWEPIKAAYLKQKMEAQARQQDVGRFYREASKESLETLAMLFNACLNNPSAAAFHEGFARGILADRHDSWPGWGEPSFEFNVQQPDGETVTIDATPDLPGAGWDDLPGGVSEPSPHLPPPPMKVEPVTPPDAPQSAAPPPIAEADRPALMAQYGLIPVAGSSTGAVFCENCKTVYVSLEDRMLRPPGPEGCSACMQKAKWG